MAEKLKEKPQVEFEIVNSTLRYKWKTQLLEKKLDYLLKNCVGCGLCMVCPWEAISLGPVVEVAAGRLEEAPLINIDEEKCTFCGVCVSLCFFNSLRMMIDHVKVEEEYSRIKGEHNIIREKCIPCLLCSKVCPMEAIDVEVKLAKKDELVKYEDESLKKKAKGTIKIDEEKCCYCGLCELLCNAIKIFWVEPKPPAYKPALNIVVDEEKCDYCGLCEKICPSEAVKVTCEYEPPRKIFEPKIEGEIRIDEEKCVDCGLCAAKCPVEALNVTKPFKGKVKFVRLEKCDPVGCKNCFNICPTKCIYPPKTEKKIEVVEDFCVFCGACEKACPEKVIEVVRETYNLKNRDQGKPWEKFRLKTFNLLIGKVEEKPFIHERMFKVEVEPYHPPPELPEEKLELPSKLKDVVKQKVDDVVGMFKDRTVRIAFEVGNMDKVLKKIHT